MHVLVTGGTGFLGGHLVERLVARGDKVRALVRRSSDTARLRSVGVELAEGDVTDRASILDAGRGIEIVYHAAALASDFGPRERFHAINVEGTRNVIEACRANRTQRLVHVSTQSVVFAFDHHIDTDESHPIPARHRDPYSATKAEAERLVLDAHGASLLTTAIRPHIIWGPRDTKFLPRVEALARSGRLILVDGGRALISTSHVDNVVHALLLAAERDAAGGEAFFVVDREPIEVGRFVSRICEAIGAPRPTRSVPYSLAFASATVLEWVWRLLGRTTPPPISRYGVALLGRNMVFRWEKAHRLLGYTPIVELEEGMRGLREWYARNPDRR